MFLTYQTLKQIAEDEFSHIVKETRLIGGMSAEPNKDSIHAFRQVPGFIEKNLKKL